MPKIRVTIVPPPFIKVIDVPEDLADPNEWAYCAANIKFGPLPDGWVGYENMKNVFEDGDRIKYIRDASGFRDRFPRSYVLREGMLGTVQYADYGDEPGCTHPFWSLTVQFDDLPDPVTLCVDREVADLVEKL